MTKNKNDKTMKNQNFNAQRNEEFKAIKKSFFETLYNIYYLTIQKRNTTYNSTYPQVGFDGKSSPTSLFGLIGF